MAWRKLAAAAIAALAVSTSLGAPAQAQGSAAPWRVSGKLFGEPRTGREPKKAENVSGIACATGSGSPRTCMVVDDEAQGAQVAIVRDGEIVAGDFIPLISDRHGGDPLELDGEAVAFADGAFYVVGSHGRPRKTDAGPEDGKANAKADASRRLFRIQFDPAAVGPDGKLASPPAITSSHELSRVLREQPAISAAWNGRLTENGLTLEGAAVRDGRFYAGLRAPLSGEKAVIVSVPLTRLFDDRPGAAAVHEIDLGRRRGVRDLAAHRDGFLVLAGPVQDPADNAVQAEDYSVFWWDGGTGTKRLGDVPAYGKGVKPEGLLPLEQQGDRLRVLVVFDGPDEGAPRRIELAAPNLP